MPWNPPAGYWEQYPEKYHHMLFDPETHVSGPAAHHGDDHGNHYEDNDCVTNPPTDEQVAAANEKAVQGAQFAEQLPILRDHQHALEVLPDHGLVFPFSIPGLEWIWDLAGWHWISWENSADGEVFNGAKPENAIYLQTDAGYEPVGVMYIADSPEGLDVGGCITGWHIHEGQEFLGYMQHLWTYGQPQNPWNDPPCDALRARECINPHNDNVLGHPDETGGAPPIDIVETLPEWAKWILSHH